MLRISVPPRRCARSASSSLAVVRLRDCVLSQVSAPPFSLALRISILSQSLCATALRRRCCRNLSVTLLRLHGTARFKRRKLQVPEKKLMQKREEKVLKKN
ncbi:uncharacterized protein LOC114395441 [Glycine soja]|uniref:uncharacterized protein LOC114395441 n=1 Tax=Glycine soja TaxID=3848 RepID=UPI001040BECD|nr:uncharacterized protein LOC114395441 [Glycine soja]